MIDVHTHIGIIQNGIRDLERKWYSAADLVRMMDRDGIAKACVLPLVSPETTIRVTDTAAVIEACAAFPGRLVPFANVDPRSCGNAAGADFSWIFNHYRDAGCRGIGEVTANLAFDDPRVLNFLRQAGDAGLPVTFHLRAAFGGEYGLVDGPGMPALERALRACPGTALVGHAPTFWCEISGGVTEAERTGYPKGPVREGGRIQGLMDRYPNLYADLSANSALNALRRDLDHAKRFLTKYRDRLMFATDYLAEGPPGEIIGFLNGLGLDKGTLDAVMAGTARKLYGL
jgi:uncharacterized protein